MSAPDRSATACCFAGPAVFSKAMSCAMKPFPTVAVCKNDDVGCIHFSFIKELLAQIFKSCLLIYMYGTCYKSG